MRRKIGRNEPCLCGSDKKYKRCCLGKDSFSLESAAQHNPLTIESISQEIEQGLTWGKTIYQNEALTLLTHMSDRYDAALVREAIQLWHSFSKQAQPVFRKAGVFSAAVEHAVAQQNGLDYMTQSVLAKEYDLAESTLSQRVKQLVEFSDPGVGIA